jgi:hypothetical protein
MISHGGAFVGFRAEMIRFPEERFSVIVLANLGTINPTQLARDVADIYFRDASDEPIEVRAEQAKPIKILKSQLEEKVGAYHDKISGRIWRINLEEDVLFMDTSFSRFRLLPLSDTLFRSVRAPVELEIAFEKSTPEKPMIMNVMAEGEETVIFEAVQMEELTLSELAEFVGEYFSPELQVSYKVQLEENKLHLLHENPYKDYPKEPLKETFEDKFQVSYIILNFFRNDKNEVDSFTMNAGRVRNIRFFRR